MGQFNIIVLILLHITGLIVAKPQYEQQRKEGGGYDYGTPKTPLTLPPRISSTTSSGYEYTTPKKAFTLPPKSTTEAPVTYNYPVPSNPLRLSRSGDNNDLSIIVAPSIPTKIEETRLFLTCSEMADEGIVIPHPGVNCVHVLRFKQSPLHNQFGTLNSESSRDDDHDNHNSLLRNIPFDINNSST